MAGFGSARFFPWRAGAPLTPFILLDAQNPMRPSAKERAHHELLSAVASFSSDAPSVIPAMPATILSHGKPAGAVVHVAGGAARNGNAPAFGDGPR
jgi:hypothetical protein